MLCRQLCAHSATTPELLELLDSPELLELPLQVTKFLHAARHTSLLSPLPHPPFPKPVNERLSTTPAKMPLEIPIHFLSWFNMEASSRTETSVVPWCKERNVGMGFDEAACDPDQCRAEPLSVVR
jgi:hypothetical protein